MHPAFYDLVESIKRSHNDAHRTAAEILEIAILTRETIIQSRAIISEADRLLARPYGYVFKPHEQGHRGGP